MVSVSGRLAQVRYAQRRGMSRTKACRVFQVSRSMLAYQRRQPGKDAQLLRRLRPIVRHHPRWGHRLVMGRLAMVGATVSRKRLLRLWRRAGLQCPTRATRRKMQTGERLNPLAMQPNEVWCYDFVHDALVNGETFRGLLVKDEASGYALAIEIARSFTANDVKAVLLRLFRRYGKPRYLRSDNGPEFVANALKEWLAERGLETAYIEPGRPWQNGSSESFNGTYRNEVLDAEVFYSVIEARIVSGRWRKLYNQRRPHSANNYRPPNTAYHFQSPRKKTA
ncbi:MAG: IS3 family transposase [Dokdonella sp.]|nr:MAG: IS3 family transposase [Gammaproteobacteria bacterium]TXI76431.1 MAG: IS3 family transposase [Dokdonella sp.]